MDSLPPETSAPALTPRAGTLLRFLRTALPYIITALVAVWLSFALLYIWPPPTQPSIRIPTNPPATMPPAAPTARPGAAAPTSPALSQGITQQELADVRAESDRKQAQIYLLLAIVQIDDAETALRTNDLASVDQSLVAIDNSLQLAYRRYERAGDSARDAVAQRRMEVSGMLDDLYLYPENMDQRLNTLRQLTLALITEQQP